MLGDVYITLDLGLKHASLTGTLLGTQDACQQLAETGVGHSAYAVMLLNQEI
jgi:hypothetical protein